MQKRGVLEFFHDWGFWTLPSPGDTNRFQEAPLLAVSLLISKEAEDLAEDDCGGIDEYGGHVVIIMMLIAIVTCWCSLRSETLEMFYKSDMSGDEVYDGEGVG